MTATDATVSPMAEAWPVRRARLMDLERAKGLMMVLVVVGHIADPAGPAWATTLRGLIYSFHMPFFMYLSGFLFAYTGAHVMKPDFGGYVLRRARRLLIPFLVVAVAIISLKLASEHYVSVNKPVGSALDAYYRVFFATDSSPVVTIWYLFVLFAFSVMVPPLYRLFGDWRPILALGLVLHAYWVLSLPDSEPAFAHVALTDAFYLNRVCWFLLYFAVGCWAAAHRERWLAAVDRAWVPALVGFAVLLPLMLVTEWRYLVVGLLSIPAIHGLMRSGVVGERGAVARSVGGFLAFVGEYTMVIYLLNTLFIGVVRGGLAKVAPPGQHMLAFYLVAAPVALFGPILVRMVLQRLPPTRGLATYLT